MRKIIFASLVLFLLLCTVFNVSAVTTSQQGSSPEYTSDDELSEALGLEELYDSLSDEAKASLQNIGIGEMGANVLDEVTFSSVISEILGIVSQHSFGILSAFSAVIVVLLLCNIIDGFADSLQHNSLKEVLSVVSALSIACALVIPATELITTAADIIKTSSNFMLGYIPVMLAVLISAGNTLSGSGYYSMMSVAAQFISQLASKLITPLLNVFLGLSISNSIVPQLRLQGMLSAFSKTIKWMLSFSFTIFSALLTFKTLISTSVDNVSTRAVRYTMSSFVPVVGTALSEAYKTVQGSISILKNGVGVFVIFAVVIIFLPVLTQILMWLFSLAVLKSFAEILGHSVPVEILSGVSTVMSVLLAVILCIMALYIISTALIMTAGGYAV